MAAAGKWQPGPSTPPAPPARAILLACAATAAALFVASVRLHLGRHEDGWRLDDPFFWARRLALAAVGLAGLCAYARRPPWRLPAPMLAPMQLGWRVPVICYGLLVGLAAPLQPLVPPPAATETGATLLWAAGLAAMAVAHVTAEALFFQGALMPALGALLPDRRLATVACGMLYGAYHLTYGSFWREPGPQVAMHDVGAIVLFAGIPYAWLACRGGTLRAPAVCPLMVQAAMLAHSAQAALAAHGR